MNTEVKICGLTNVEDARVALAAGADYLGFIMYLKSPRGITENKLAEILGSLDGSFRAIGVFVNETRKNVERIARECALSAVQIHGDESADDFLDMPVTLWRAVKFSEGSIRPDPLKWCADRYLVDAATPGVYGGSGVMANWGVAKEFVKDYPVMLAGGLTADNVAEAVKFVSPLGVDTASGVEIEPGRKDHDKIRRFVKNAKAIV